MWVKKKKWKTLEKKVTDLEAIVQGQNEIFQIHLEEHSKSVKELKDIINSLKNYVVSGNEQIR